MFHFGLIFKYSLDDVIIDAIANNKVQHNGVQPNDNVLGQETWLVSSASAVLFDLLGLQPRELKCSMIFPSIRSEEVVTLGHQRHPHQQKPKDTTTKMRGLQRSMT